MKAPIKAILVDDESSARDVLANLLLRFCPEVEVVEKCPDVETAVEAIKRLRPDAVFLDIEMPNYAGYEIVKFFDTVDFEIVFVTAYDKFAIKAFELSAVDYLLKPIDLARLKAAVARLREKVQAKILQNSYALLVESLQSKSVTKIAVPHNRGQTVIPVESIIAIEAQNAYSSIHTADGQQYLASKNLKHFESLFEGHPDFFRSHKSWLINLKHLVSYSKSEMEIRLAGGLLAKLSKYKKGDFEGRVSH